MNHEERKKLLIVLVIIMGGLYVGVNFVFDQLSSWWAGRATEIRDLRSRLAEGRSLQARDAIIRSHWKDMQANAFPANTSQAEQQLLRSVDGWAGSTGVEVSSIMPQWKEESTNYMTLNCHVETAGDLGTLTRFLYDLESGPQAIRLDAVEFGAHDATGQQLTLSVDINGLALGAKEVK